MLNTRRTGFTLVEMLIVMAVMGTLAILTIVGYRGISQQTANTQTQSDLSKASELLEGDFIDDKLYPATAAEVNNNAGFKPKPGTTLTYVPSGDRKSFCLQAASNKAGTKTYKILQEGTVKEGTCSGGGGGGGGSYPGPAWISACAHPSGGYNVGWPSASGITQSHVVIETGYETIDDEVGLYSPSLFAYDLGQGGGGGSVNVTVEYINSSGQYSTPTSDTVTFYASDCYD